MGTNHFFRFTRIASANYSFRRPSPNFLLTSLLLAMLAFCPWSPVANQQMFREIAVPLQSLETRHRIQKLSYV